MNDKPKFTSGPWGMGKILPGDKEIEFSGVEGVYVDYDDVNHEEAEANAHLISAAPELLEAAEIGLGIARGERMSRQVGGFSTEEQDQQIKLIENAIKKARGE